MGNLYIIPDWFFGYTIILGLIFGIITLIVGVYALKIYKLSAQKASKNFGIGFIFISIAYFIQTILNLVLFSKLQIQKVISLSTFNMWGNIGIYLYMLFFLAGLITLVYVTLGVNNFRVYSLLFILLMGSLIITPFKLNIFHIFSSILFVYIIIHYLINYLRNKNYKNLIVFIAFIFLLLSNIQFIFSLKNGLYYVIGDILSFVAYLLILINLIIVLFNSFCLSTSSL